MTENLSHALKGELIPATININDLQIPVAGASLPSGKYFSHFLHFDLELWEHTIW